MGEWRYSFTYSISDTNRSWAVSFTPWPLYSAEKETLYLILYKARLDP
jgi:hypothetical protein